MLSDNFYISGYNLTGKRRYLQYILRLAGIYSTLLIFAAGIYLMAARQIPAVIFAVIAFVLAQLVLAPFIRFFYKKPRPYQKLNFLPPFSVLFSRQTKKHNSFPSDHAASFASIALVFYWFFPPLGIVFFILAFLNGLARIALGYHYPIDVVAGWLLGLGAGWLAILLLPRLFT